MSAADRERRTAEADALCARAYAASGGAASGLALVAVGGYGRRQLAPWSDLDVVLVADEGVPPGEVAEQLWYPLWDSGARVDHAVRDVDEMVTAAAADLKVTLGLLDVRHLAGDPHLTLRLRGAVLAEWRARARARLPELRELVRARQLRVGEVAHQSVPDLKEGAGGLRDATVLDALVATWLVDVPHTDLQRCRGHLLDVRDRLHEVAGRATDRVAPEHWDGLAAELGLPDRLAAQRHVRGLGRRMTHLSRLTWRRVDAALERPAGRRMGGRGPALHALGHGLALGSGEVVLDARARPDRDPLLLLRAACEAAERDVVLAPATAARLARDAAPVPEPWPAEGRRLLVRLLSAGRGLLPVWETLDETGALVRILPEWEEIRLLPHASAIHRFTVDRHVVETCIEASALIRRVRRPDVLMVAALLHDIGKGGPGDHSLTGERVAGTVARRMGFDESTVRLVELLVRQHLLLATTATTRDLEDPSTVADVARRTGTVEAVDLLLALTEADARATAPQAWTVWRSGLVARLAERVRLALADAPVHREPTLEVVTVPDSGEGDALSVEVRPHSDGATVTVVAEDRIGLLADVAATLAWQAVPVRTMRAWEQGGAGVSVWQVADPQLDPAVLRHRLGAIADGRLDPGERLSRTETHDPDPVVVVRPEASTRATVLEVRTADRPGTVHRVCAALAGLDLSVRSAHAETLGPQAVDVFYVQETGAGVLSDERAATAAHAVRAALAPFRDTPGTG